MVSSSLMRVSSRIVALFTTSGIHEKVQIRGKNANSELELLNDTTYGFLAQI